MKSKNRTHLHVHVTVTNFPEITPKGWKETTIKLCSGGRWQTDHMLTKHFMFENDKPFIDTILTQIMFLPLKEHEIIRVKIEQESNFPDIIPAGNYLEIHAETTQLDYLPDNWVWSYNPKRKNIQFINRRVYTGNIQKILSFLDEEVKSYDVEYRPELIIYDSNHSHDAWWA
jgi:hypothetical protein